MVKKERRLISLLFSCLAGAIFLLVSQTAPAQSPWSGPTLVTTLTWGNGTGQVGWRPFYMGDYYPSTIHVDGEGNMVIRDYVNYRVLILNPDGSLRTTINIPPQERPKPENLGPQDGWPEEVVLNSTAHRILLTSQYSGACTVYDYDGHVMGRFANPFWPSVPIYALPDGYVLVNSVSENKTLYYTCDINGANLQKSAERPPGMGICSGSGAGTTITFPNHVLHGAIFERFCGGASYPYPYILADNGDLLDCTNQGLSFERCSPTGKLLGKIELPKAKYLVIDQDDITTSYIIYTGAYDPHGNIYATRAERRESVMKPLQILKWTWTGGSSSTQTKPAEKSAKKPKPSSQTNGGKSK